MMPEISVASGGRYVPAKAGPAGTRIGWQVTAWPGREAGTQPPSGVSTASTTVVGRACGGSVVAPDEVSRTAVDPSFETITSDEASDPVIAADAVSVATSVVVRAGSWWPSSHEYAPFVVFVVALTT